MFPDDARLARSAHPHHRVAAAAGATAPKKPSGAHHQLSAERDGLAVVAAAGAGQRGTLYDSFELNAMVVRLNRVLIGDRDGEARRPRKPAAGSGSGSWLNAPKVFFRKIRRAFLGGGRRGDG